MIFLIIVLASYYCHDQPTTCNLSFVQMMNLANSCLIVGEKRIDYIFLLDWLILGCVQTDATTPNNVGTCSATWEGYNPYIFVNHAYWACVAPTMLEELCKRIQHCCATLRRSRNKEMLGVVGWKVWPVSNFAQQHATTSNNMQKGVQTEATCNIQQCCVRLHGALKVGIDLFKKYHNTFCCHFLLQTFAQVLFSILSQEKLKTMLM